MGLILALRRDPAFTDPLPMWAWVVETGKERILIDAGGRPGIGGGVTGTRFQIKPEQDLVRELAHHGLRPEDIDRVLDDTSPRGPCRRFGRVRFAAHLGREGPSGRRWRASRAA